MTSEEKEVINGFCIMSTKLEEAEEIDGFELDGHDDIQINYCMDNYTWTDSSCSA